MPLPVLTSFTRPLGSMYIVNAASVLFAGFGQVIAIATLMVPWLGYGAGAVPVKWPAGPSVSNPLLITAELASVTEYVAVPPAQPSIARLIGLCQNTVGTTGWSGVLC